MGYVGKINAGGTTHLVGSTLYGTCSTAASTSEKAVVCSNFSALETGVTIHVLFSNAIYQTDGPDGTPITPTLNVNSTGARPINPADIKMPAQSLVSLTYDGSNWNANDYQPTAFTDILQTTATTYLVSTDLTNSVAYSTPVTYSNNGNLSATNFVGKHSGYTLAAACAKGVDTSIAASSTSTNLPTTAAVVSYVASQMGEMAGAMVYKGTVTAESQLLNTALSKGWYYIVAMPNAQTTAISIAGESCEAGDMVIVNTGGTYANSTALAAATDIIQTNTAIITNAEIDVIVNS